MLTPYRSSATLPRHACWRAALPSPGHDPASRRPRSASLPLPSSRPQRHASRRSALPATGRPALPPSRCSGSPAAWSRWSSAKLPSVPRHAWRSRPSGWLPGRSPSSRRRLPRRLPSWSSRWPRPGQAVEAAHAGIGYDLSGGKMAGVMVSCRRSMGSLHHVYWGWASNTRLPRLPFVRGEGRNVANTFHEKR
jgi:hypothetical protein